LEFVEVEFSPSLEFGEGGYFGEESEKEEDEYGGKAV
jgi:hypothetical protein